MREKLRPDEILYTVILVTVGILMTVILVAVFILPRMRSSLLRAAFAVGFLVNLLIIVRRTYSGQRKGLLFFIAFAAMSLYFALRW